MVGFSLLKLRTRPEKIFPNHTPTEDLRQAQVELWWGEGKKSFLRTDPIVVGAVVLPLMGLCYVTFRRGDSQGADVLGRAS